MERETMRLMPAITQPFFSWLTAKPLPEQLQARRQLTPLFHLAISMLLLFLGVTICAVAYNSGSVLGYIPGFILATSGTKQLQVMICHNAAHDVVLATRTGNGRMGRLISGVLLLKPFNIYKAEHVFHHDHKTLLTDLDDTLSFLSGNVGLRPYNTVAQMWRKLVFHALSPLAILAAIRSRVSSNITNDEKFVSIMTVGGWVIALLAAAYFGVLDTFLMAWAVPIFVGFHICSTFRLAAEHTWPTPDILRDRGIAFIAESTTGVFIGEPLIIPDSAGRAQRAAIIAVWLSKMLTFHLFIRLFVMVGDTPCHDFHHRRPRSRDWPNYITARESDLQNGSKPFPKNYLDIWGYVNAVTNNFRSYRAAHDYYFYDQGIKPEGSAA